MSQKKETRFRLKCDVPNCPIFVQQMGKSPKLPRDWSMVFDLPKHKEPKHFCSGHQAEAELETTTPTSSILVYKCDEPGCCAEQQVPTTEDPRFPTGWQSIVTKIGGGCEDESCSVCKKNEEKCYCPCHRKKIVVLPPEMVDYSPLDLELAQHFTSTIQIRKIELFRKIFGF